ncbi:S-layer protein [Candidatus Woesearchaeota archaeon]|nr:S-layer protein [Candidatus Woesearchaeota archaeon]
MDDSLKNTEVLHNMKVKKAVRKLIALTAGATIVGATLAGAMAQDLSNYPEPFVEDGVWTDSVIVVGENAETTDVLGAIEIAASLQADAYSLQPIETDGATAPTISEGIKIENAGNEFNFNEEIYDIDTNFGNEDLPEILEDDKYSESKGSNKNEVDYEQDIVFNAANGDLYYAKEDSGNEVFGPYIVINDGTTFYTYTVDIDGYVEYDNSSATNADNDWVSSTIELQGNTYTVTDVSLSSGKLDKIEMMAGETVRWLEQDQPLTVGDHTITVVSVDEAETMCGVQVDGEKVWVDVGSTEDFGGLSVGVIDAIAVHSKDYDQDTCEISIGSQEVVLDNGDAVQVGGTDIDYSTVTFTESTGGRLTQIDVAYYPEDDIYLAPGETWTDPVFGNFKLQFADVTKDTEEMTLKTSSNSGSFKFMNIEGDEVELEIVDDDANDKAGWGFDDDWIGDVYTLAGAGTNQAMILNDGDYCKGTSSAEDCKGIEFLVVSSGFEARVFELANIDETGGSGNGPRIKYKDITKSGSTSNWEDHGLIDIGPATVNITVNASTNTVQFFEVNLATSDIIKTSKLARLKFNQGGNNVSVNITEDDAQTDDNGQQLQIYAKLDSNDDLQSYVTSAASGDWSGEIEEDSDYTMYATQYGTEMLYDTENTDDITISYPEERAYGNVFIAPLSAEVSGGSSGGTINREIINELPVGIAKLDSEAEGMSKNMIVVGGPCANTIAADLAGNPASCAEGYEPGKAKIKLYDRSGKTALLVAGYSAKDTLGASYVLARNDDYDLSGDEVEVVVASLTDISVTSAS